MAIKDEFNRSQALALDAENKALMTEIERLTKERDENEGFIFEAMKQLRAANEDRERLRARLGIVLSALRQHEEATGEAFDDEGGDIAGVEAELRNHVQQGDKSCDTSLPPSS